MALLRFSARTWFSVSGRCLLHRPVKPLIIGRVRPLHTQRMFVHLGNDNSAKKLNLNFETSPITQCSVTKEIQFYSHCGYKFSQGTFSDPTKPHGTPLAILLPWEELGDNVLKKFIEFYGEKGFDVVTVSLTPEQFLYPCVAGNAMNVVSNLLDYLNEAHKHRPYIFHGFSVGVYIFGEFLAQLSDHYETYKEMLPNIKGCLWDSPVDVIHVKSQIGKFLYPKKWVRRFDFFASFRGFEKFAINWDNFITSRWRCNRAVRAHFKNHHHDSVVYWIRSRDCFCDPIVKVPNVFFVSCTDLLSNPNTLQCVQKVLECNGVPVFQKTWPDSPHLGHFQKYCYEYIYGMALFFNLISLNPYDFGKLQNSCTSNNLSDMKLKAIE